MGAARIDHLILANVIGQPALPHTLTQPHSVMPFSKSKAPEDPETKNTIEADPGADDESASGSDVDHDGDAPAADASESGSSRPSSKKKKKKRSKIARAISAIKGDSVPQAVVDQVVAKVKEEHGEDSAAADEETVRELLKQLKLKDVAEGKAGLGGKNRKDTGDHKVCHLCASVIVTFLALMLARWCSSGRRNLCLTSVRCIYPVCEPCSPILALDDMAPEEDGYIEPSKPREEVRQEPFPLPKDFEWSVLDTTTPSQV